MIRNWHTCLVVGQSPGRIQRFVTLRTAECQVSLSLTGRFSPDFWSVASLKLFSNHRLIIFSFVNVSCMLICLSHVRLFVTPWTVALQAPLSMGFSRQEYRGGLPCPPPGDLPDPGVEPVSFMSPALADGPFTTLTTQDAQMSATGVYLRDREDWCPT